MPKSYFSMHQENSGESVGNNKKEDKPQYIFIRTILSRSQRLRTEKDRFMSLIE